jgi:competence protein ComEA
MNELLLKPVSSIRCAPVVAALFALVLGCSTNARADSDAETPPPRVERVIEAEPTTIVSRVGEGTVNINTATADELERLPGVGPSRAAAILTLRQRMGRFSRAEDLLRVRGIGRATLRRMRASVALDGATTLTDLPPRRGRVPDLVATNE